MSIRLLVILAEYDASAVLNWRPGLTHGEAGRSLQHLNCNSGAVTWLLYAHLWREGKQRKPRDLFGTRTRDGAHDEPLEGWRHHIRLSFPIFFRPIWQKEMEDALSKDVGHYFHLFGGGNAFCVFMLRQWQILFFSVDVSALFTTLSLSRRAILHWLPAADHQAAAIDEEP